LTAALGDNRLLVVLDEMQALFLHDNTTHMRFVADVETLAKCTSGRIYFIGCGSTHVLHRLITSTCPTVLKQVFPLQNHDMNASKLHPLPLTTASSVDINQVLPFFPSIAQMRHPSTRIGMQRIVTYTLGTSPCALDAPHSIHNDVTTIYDTHGRN
jgi:hypothetical protein